MVVSLLQHQRFQVSKAKCQIFNRIKYYSRSNFLKQTNKLFFFFYQLTCVKENAWQLTLLPVVPWAVFYIQSLALWWEWVGRWVMRMQREEDTNHIAFSLQTCPVSSLISIICDDLSILYLLLPVLTLPSGRGNIYFPLQAVV